MWLLNTVTLELKEFIGANVPPYAILSHTWGPAEDEISFRDMRKYRDAAVLKKGYAKVKSCCAQAAQDRFQYAWIDSCCIDKRSSAELSEAINSMYRYYKNAQVCYAYLHDVPGSGIDLSREDSHDDTFSKSSWFTRGWTLQELVAPRVVQFFGADWTQIGTKERQDKGLEATGNRLSLIDPFLRKLAMITGISREVLQDSRKMERTSVAQRMSWAARRETTRVEDMAYSLMGLFNIHMPILYGEGEVAAFQRLQLQIIQSIPDQSLFAWRANRESSGLLAESPRDFVHSSRIQNLYPRTASDKPWSMTNLGLQINLPLSSYTDDSGRHFILAKLRCWNNTDFHLDTESERVQIYLLRVDFITRAYSANLSGNLYRRLECNSLKLDSKDFDLGISQDICVLEDSHFNAIVYY